MKNTVKSRKEEEDSDASSPFSHLPEEMILEILNKLIDLKTLCCCYLVSKRFSSIVLKVDAIAFTAPPLIPNNNTVGDLTNDSNEFPQRLPFPPELFSFYGESIPSAIRFMIKFKELKSLRIELPSSREIGIDTNCLFKWKLQVGKKIESFSFLAFDSIYDEYGFHIDGIIDEEENGYSYAQKNVTWFQCLKDVMVRHRMLLYLVKHLPKLEEVSITDKDRRGRLSTSGEKLSEVKEWLHTSASETVFSRIEIPKVQRQWNIYTLNLPGSGCVIEMVHCVLIEIDGVMNSENGFEGKERAVYTEALEVILARQS